MRHGILLTLLLWTSCTWSNSLYQARRLSGSAVKAEREERSFDAGSIWGQVAVKAESAYARTPNGSAGAEALWLRGRALAHLGDCPQATPLLDRARLSPDAGGWRGELVLELARCKVREQNADGALVLLEPLFDHESEELRLAASLLAGRALADAGRWAEAAERLAVDPSVEGQWAYAVALAELGRAEEALRSVEPRLLAIDSTADWTLLLRALARHDLPVADRLVAALAEFPRQGDAARARWLLATATGAEATDPAEATRRLEAVLALGQTPSAPRARNLLADQLVSGVVDASSLRAVMQALRPYAAGDVTTAFFVSRYTRWGERLLADVDSLSFGDPEGDMAMWFDAGLARDTLRAPQLADWFLRRLEQGWPQSAYLPKALLTRIPLVPDSAEAIRARLGGFADSEYLAYLRGAEGPGFTALEDSLAFYIGGRWATIAPGMAAGFGDDQ
jgi:hypothetical protein